MLLNNRLPAHVAAADGRVLDGSIECHGHLVEMNMFKELECQKLFVKMIRCLIQKELDVANEINCFPQRHNHKVIQQMKDIVEFFATLFENCDCWMHRNNHKFNCPCAMNNNKCICSNLFSSLEIRDHCHRHKTHSWKESIKHCEENTGFYHNCLIHVLESFDETKKKQIC